MGLGCETTCAALHGDLTQSPCPRPPESCAIRLFVLESTQTPYRRGEGVTRGAPAIPSLEAAQSVGSSDPASSILHP
jgi:hypothetical protein